MLVIRWRVSAALQAALTIRKRWSSRRVREQRVALLADRQVDHVHRHQRLERLGRIVADQAKLAHVRDIEQRRRLAAVPMFLQDAGGVRHRHLVAGELDHLGAELEVERVQRCA
jgi:hypothetical protein